MNMQDDPESSTDCPDDSSIDNIADISATISVNGTENSANQTCHNPDSKSELISLDDNPCIKKRKSYANSFKLEVNIPKSSLE